MTSTVGATVHVHYCMDRVAGWGFSSPEDKACNQCGMDTEASKDCCKDTKAEVKLKADQKQFSSSDLKIAAPHIIAPVFNPYGDFLVVSTPVRAYPFAHGPPLLGNLPIYLRTRSLLL
ncbi:hypothetical protein GCM10023184_38790 [Flaviaesturariibacter amylovorans]|uniref:Uncharacterized protein n=2 Tax=Flaviaesturariibacter amylovorans TaxID=1084520 RepID=A0ABP8HL89_9BACT